MNFDIDFSIMREPGFYKRFFKERKNDTKFLHNRKLLKSCPICLTPNDKETVIYSTEYGNYRRCRTCSCLYLDLVEKENKTHYPLQDTNTVSTPYFEMKREYRKQRFASERISIIEKYSELPINELSLLDINCGTGFFIESAKECFKNVVGYEQRKKLAAYTSKKTGCKVYTDFKKINEKFDVITIFDSLEHFEKPFEFLRHCKSLLKNGGMLLVFTSNYVSVSFETLKNENTHFLPAYLFSFCRESVDYFSRKLDMMIAMCETKGLDFFDILSYERDINKLDLSKTLLLEKVNLFQNILDSFGHSNTIRFILKKKDRDDRFSVWFPPVFDANGWAYQKIASGSLINPFGWRCQHHNHLKVGNETDIGCFTYLNAKYGIEIGKKVQIGSGCSIYSESTIGDKKGCVKIGDNTMIGSHSIIMPGVTIGKNVIIGANTFVNKSVPSDSTVFGTPCRIRRRK